MSHAHNFIDITGNRYGRLTVISEAPKKGKRLMWNCHCDCGNDVIVQGDYLKNGTTKSCGCLQREVARRPSNVTHGQSYTRLYEKWNSMLSRVLPSYHGHKDYYDRGIIVCDEWKDFVSFETWAKENGYQDDLTLDRIDVNGNYEPSNCRWVTWKEQENNKRNNVFIEIDGETKTMKQWSEYFGVNYGMVKMRHRKGWSDDRLFLPPYSTKYAC